MAGKTHSPFAPSAAHRWTKCIGSLSLEPLFPVTTSPYAEEGTRAHDLLERCLRDGVRRADTMTDDAELAAAAQTYLDYVWPILDTASAFAVEQQVSMDIAGQALYGTPDLVAEVGTRLVVIDYKHGAGVAVEAVGNRQLALYALAYLPQAVNDIETVELVIIQPRARHVDGPIRRWEMSTVDLLDVRAEVESAIRRYLAGDRTFSAGPHCRFCRAFGACPEAARTVREKAQSEFADVRLLSPERIGELLAWHDDFIAPWVRALRAHVAQTLEAGGNVPGWKLVQKRATRRWSDPAKVEEWARKMRLRMSDIYEKTLISVARMEKLVGRSNVPADLVVSESSGTSIARTTDPRDAVSAGGQEFFGGGEDV